MHASSTTSNALLPAEVSAHAWFGRARNYPIFSPIWYRYRSLSLLAASAPVFLLLALLLGASTRMGEGEKVGNVAWLFMPPLFVLCLAGPALAVLIRRMALPRRVEAISILAVLLLGMALSGALLALLAYRHERPHAQLENDWVVAQSLPKFSVTLQAHPGATQLYAGWRHRRHAPGTPAPSPAKGSPSAFASLGSQERQALADIIKLDEGDPTIDPARRPEIEKKYAESIEKLFAYSRQHHEPDPPGGKTYTLRGNLEAAPSAIDPEEISVALAPLGGIFLFCWLGGLFDLAAFARQRGKLVDVLHQQALLRAQAARNSAELRLSVLAAQVEPHFLFNTLASVRSAIASDPQRATHLIDHMVDFLRSTIPQMRDDAANATVRLDSQLASVRSYLALMHARIPRLQFSVDAEAGLEHALLPPLMLISLVENAVKHGIEPKVGAARIAVRARRTDTLPPQLEVCVSDDGVGFGEAASGDGLGLANIQERLRSYFGPNASLTLKALPQRGVAAILSLPLSFELTP